MNPTTLDPTVLRTPAVFAGGDPFAADEVRRTLRWRAGDPDWARRVTAEVGTGERALVSVPFAAGEAAVAHVVAPRELASPSVPTARDRVHDVVEVPQRAVYVESVRTALGRIAAGDVDKVVLGRCLEVRSTPALTPHEVTASLVARRPGGYVFSLPLDEGEDAPWLVGASPELLLRRSGDQVWSTPLAGSAPRSTDPAEDARRAESLRASAKDLAEHAFVVDRIAAALAPVCAFLDVPRTPELLATDSMWHLASPIRGRLAPPHDLTALDLAELLHPTPAVGGVPVDAAMRLIDELEGRDLRGPFGGYVGWLDEHGDGELAVTIRAGVLDGECLRLFAGAGIVADSDPEAEADETAAKLTTMTKVVGL